MAKVMPRNQLPRTGQSVLGLDEGAGPALPRLVGLGAGEWCSSVLCVQGAPASNFICIFPVSISCFMRQFSHAFISPIKLGVLIPLLLTKNESRI